MQRESIEYDVVIVGGGPAGLGTAIRLKQLAGDANTDLRVCVLEKGSEIGAHILSGAIIEPRALNELIPDWQQKQAPVDTAVSEDAVHFLLSAQRSIKIPGAFVPPSMHNRGNYVISLGNLCRWLGGQAEALGVDIFPGFPAADILYNDAGAVCGVTTRDMGIDARGQAKPGHEPGMNILGKYTVFAEGSRGHLAKQLYARFGPGKDADPQHYGIGLKELWQVVPERHRPGLVVHCAGWPLDRHTGGGSFMYHLQGGQVAVGLIVDLNYRNPYLSPFEEFQRMKHHPVFANTLSGGKRISYGARSITKGGYNALPKMSVPGALLIGCDAGTLNFSKIKGTHTAMKSGMIAADTIFNHLHNGGDGGQDLTAFDAAFRASWAGDELQRSRNFGPALHRYGSRLGGVFNYIEQILFRGHFPFTVRDRQTDHDSLQEAARFQKIDYPKPDSQLSFDRMSSVYLSSTMHEEDQPCHLQLQDDSIPVKLNYSKYAGPEQRYCPAGVYEFIQKDNSIHLQINAQNCIHCKTCDIKDPTQNINWTAPEGGGGPNYPNM